MTREQALLEFDGFVRQFARQFAVAGLSVEDLEQEARLALLLAIDAYKPGTRSLKNYVCWYIRTTLKAYKRNNTDRVTMSLDEDVFNDDDGNPVTRHDLIGTAPEQESKPVHELAQKKVSEAASRAAKQTRNGRHSSLEEIIRLRSGGLTFAEIGKRIGKSTMAVVKVWHRAQKRFAENAA